MRFGFDVVPLMRTLVAIAVMETNLYQIRISATKLFELHIMVYILRFIVCSGIDWYFYPVQITHVVIKIHVCGGC